MFPSELANTQDLNVQYPFSLINSSVTFTGSGLYLSYSPGTTTFVEP